MQHIILVVDDEKDIIDSLERQFRKQYKILKATSGIDALRILNQESVHLILSDQRMPEMTGVQLFERAQKLQPDAIRILLTGYTDVESVIAAINNGQIYRYITKPWDPIDLDIIVKKALETFDLKFELKEKNKKLEQALEELKSLDQAKSHFMLLIGHELRTPLTTISSFTELLLEENLKDDVKKYVSRISQGTNRLSEIIFDVLDLLGAETGQTKLNKSKSNLSELINNTTDEFKDLVKKRSLKIKSNLKANNAFYDSTVIKKVFKKILHNALKFSTENSEVIISTSDDKDGVTLKITNDGAPISQSKIQQILKPFTLDEDIMNHSQGLGLGLSVCQSLLKHHGSLLVVDSHGNQTSVGFHLRTNA
ncbi:MAG: hybrid sensor histidine kinase/response regulator [Oligoflexia bacterium]|nr:hybrid sensor histidine kinase/response regulator [Oligoflexia bacterium]